MRVLFAAVLAFIVAGMAGGFFGAMLRSFFPMQLRDMGDGLYTLIALVLIVPLFISFMRILRRSSSGSRERE